MKQRIIIEVESETLKEDAWGEDYYPPDVEKMMHGEIFKAIENFCGYNGETDLENAVFYELADGETIPPDGIDNFGDLGLKSISIRKDKEK